jgi:hypothetical protein
MEIIIFTNEHYIDILNITLPRFVEYLKPLNLRINVVTNRLVNNTGINFDGVNIIETGVDFEYDGSHFRQSMLHALSELNCEYFLFFCDDYILNSMTKKESFELAKTTVYKNGTLNGIQDSPSIMPISYKTESFELAEKRVVMSGIRLGKKLSELFGS